MQRLSLAVSLVFAATSATAQFAVVIPTGTANAAGSTSNAFPWGTSASTFPGLRHLSVYDASNFTNQNVTTPILVNRLRWRPDDTAPSQTGGTFTTATVQMSTAPVDYTAITNAFAPNHGTNLTTVYSGPVVHTPTLGASGWTPQSWCVDIQLTTPFLYDPSAGDLVIDVDYPTGSFQGGTVGAMDVQTFGCAAARVWASSNYPNTNGRWQDHGVVVEVGYVPPSGVAYSLPYGEGCIDEARASFYELFPSGAFDLSNTAWQFVPTGSGYFFLPATPTWRTPTSPPLLLGTNTVSSAQNLGFLLSYPGGTTSSVQVASNGFLWAQSNTNNGCCQGAPQTLLTLGARWCPLWTGLDPSAGGTIHFETDAANGAAYVTFLNVRESGTTSTSTFQVAFFANGTVEFRYQNCAVTNHQTLTGWSPGANNLNRGSIDLSVAATIVTSPDLNALRHAASARPRLGSTIQLTTSSLPAGALLGATIGGLTELNPGLDLGPIGMPGCRQFVSADAAIAWLPGSGTGGSPFAIPASPSLAGIAIRTQGAALVPGINTLGALTSNGLRLVIDAN